MKNVKLLAFAGLFAMGIQSCTVVHTAVVTNNPVGTKKYTLKKGAFTKDQGVSYNEAMKKGNIKKLGVAEYKLKYFLIFPSQQLTITGE
jgi:uncharacterized protein involved in high-affinity Fe2+ transport